MVNLGNAIRSGDAQYVYEMIENNNGIETSALSRRGIGFETTFRRETKAMTVKTSNSTLDKEEGKSSIFYAHDSIMINRAKFNISDKMYVTPFHLAIIAQHADIIYIMLEATLQFSKSKQKQTAQNKKHAQINFAR